MGRAMEPCRSALVIHLGRNPRFGASGLTPRPSTPDCPSNALTDQSLLSFLDLDSQSCLAEAAYPRCVLSAMRARPLEQPNGRLSDTDTHAILNSWVQPGPATRELHRDENWREHGSFFFAPTFADYGRGSGALFAASGVQLPQQPTDG